MIGKTWYFQKVNPIRIDRISWTNREQARSDHGSSLVLLTSSAGTIQHSNVIRMSNFAAVWKVAGSTPTADRAVFWDLITACNVRRDWFIGIEWGLGSVDLGSIPAQAVGFNRVMTPSKLCTYTCALANQAIHPFAVDKLIPDYRQFVGR